MHPSKFFEECSIRTGIDVVEVYDGDLKEKLKNVHPKNFLKTQIAFRSTKSPFHFRQNPETFERRKSIR